MTPYAWLMLTDSAICLCYSDVSGIPLYTVIFLCNFCPIFSSNVWAEFLKWKHGPCKRLVLFKSIQQYFNGRSKMLATNQPPCFRCQLFSVLLWTVYWKQLPILLSHLSFYHSFVGVLHLFWIQIPCQIYCEFVPKYAIYICLWNLNSW